MTDNRKCGLKRCGRSPAGEEYLGLEGVVWWWSRIKMVRTSGGEKETTRDER
jgi:hypothetical protein